MTTVLRCSLSNSPQPVRCQHPRLSKVHGSRWLLHTSESTLLKRDGLGERAQHTFQSSFKELFSDKTGEVPCLSWKQEKGLKTHGGGREEEKGVRGGVGLGDRDSQRHSYKLPRNS